MLYRRFRTQRLAIVFASALLFCGGTQAFAASKFQCVLNALSGAASFLRPATKGRQVLPFVAGDDPVLSAATRELSPQEIRSPSTQEFFDDMVYTMQRTGGIGIAAPQVGKSLRAAVILRDFAPFVIVNPKVTVLDARKSIHLEACLSLPWDVGFVARPRKIRVQGFDRHGNPISLDLRGLQAAVAQHEIDHLDGVLFSMRWKRYPGKFGFQDTTHLTQEIRVELGRMLHSLSSDERSNLERRSWKIAQDLYDATDEQSLAYGVGGFKELLHYHKILLSQASPELKARRILDWTQGSMNRAKFVLNDLARFPEDGRAIFSYLKQAPEFAALKER